MYMHPNFFSLVILFVVVSSSLARNSLSCLVLWAIGFIQHICPNIYMYNHQIANDKIMCKHIMYNSNNLTFNIFSHALSIICISCELIL